MTIRQQFHKTLTAEKKPLQNGFLVQNALTLTLFFLKMLMETKTMLEFLFAVSKLSIHLNVPSANKDKNFQLTK